MQTVYVWNELRFVLSQSSKVAKGKILKLKYLGVLAFHARHASKARRAGLRENNKRNILQCLNFLVFDSIGEIAYKVVRLLGNKLATTL